jgi:splicing factor 3A subunit 3
MFSGEEARGRFLDLNAPFDSYINLKSINRINYLAYITTFDKFSTVPADTRKSAAYKKYLVDLVEYLSGFCARAMPLLDVDAAREEAAKDAEEWAREEVQAVREKAVPELFCAPCGKQFASRQVFEYHLPGKKHKKAASAAVKVDGGESMVVDDGGRADAAIENAKQVRMMEDLVQKLAESLAAIREDTRDLVERKQTLSADEIVRIHLATLFSQ